MGNDASGIVALERDSINHFRNNAGGATSSERSNNENDIQQQSTSTIMNSNEQSLSLSRNATLSSIRYTAVSSSGIEESGRSDKNCASEEDDNVPLRRISSMYEGNSILTDEDFILEELGNSSLKFHGSVRDISYNNYESNKFKKISSRMNLALMHRIESTFQFNFTDSKTHSNFTDFQMIAAARNGATSTIHKLLKLRKSNVNYRSEKDGSTALWNAAMHGHYETVGLLIHSGADVNVGCLMNRTPLWISCLHNRLEVAKILLENGKADPNLCDNDRYSPLHKAIEVRNPDLVRLLLQANASTDLSDEREKGSALIIAAAEGSREIVEDLIKFGAKVDAVSQWDGYLRMIEPHANLLTSKPHRTRHINHKIAGCTALFLASLRGHKDVVQLLLEYKADLDIPDPWHDLQAEDVAATLEIKWLIRNVEERRIHLMNVLKSGEMTEIVQLFESQKENLNFHDENGQSPITFAIASCNYRLAKLIIEHGADVNTYNEIGMSALGLASQLGDYNIVKLLLDSGAHVNYCGQVGVPTQSDVPLPLETHTTHSKQETVAPLWIAIANDHTNVSKLLISSNADVNKLGKWNKSPLFVAAFNGNEEIVQALIGNNASIDVKEKRYGFTPLMKAAERAHLGVVQVLVEANADLRLNANIALVNGKEVGKSLVEAAKMGEVRDFLQEITINAERLLQAAKDDDLMTVRHLVVSTYLNKNYKDKNGDTAFIIAAARGNVPMMELLHKYKGDPTIENHKGENALSKAVQVGQYAAVKYLTSVLQMDVNHLNYNKVPIIRSAIESKNTSIVECLLEHGADITEHKLRKVLQLDCKIPLRTLSNNDYCLWFHLIQLQDVDELPLKISKLVQDNPVLIRIKDKAGRVAWDVATPQNQMAMNRVVFWYGRYRIQDHHAEHASNSCYVFRALDERKCDDSGQSVKVALKLMRFKSHFEKELKARNSTQLDPNFVVPVIATYPLSKSLEHYPEDAFNSNSFKIDETMGFNSANKLTRQQAEAMYCIVLPLADRNLFVSLKQELIQTPSGSNNSFQQVKIIFTQLVYCVDHLHSKGILHGDLKPLNFLRVDNQWKVTDLDSSSLLQLDNVLLSKRSTAYSPPEVISALVESNKQSIRSDGRSDGEGSADTFVLSHASFDVWSLGCILYQLCSDGLTPLFQSDVSDNRVWKENGDDDWHVVSQWTDATKDKKLQRIHDPMARNLISQMLSKSPDQRPSLLRVLAHPFLSNQKVARLIGEEPVYDVFLSYRVASDLEHAEILYHRLCERGVKVWWDRVCLAPGIPWQEGFCAGLIQSRTFVCLLSKNAINHNTIVRNNFSKLTESSSCDNLLLELRLALELRALRLVEKIFPVLIGMRMNSFTSRALTRSQSLDRSRKGFDVKEWASLDESNDLNTIPSRFIPSIGSNGQIQASHSKSSLSLISTGMYVKSPEEIDSMLVRTIFTDFFSLGGVPPFTTVVVQSVEDALKGHMKSQALGIPMQADQSVGESMAAILQNHGVKVEGEGMLAFDNAVECILNMLYDESEELANNRSDPNRSEFSLLPMESNSDRIPKDSMKLISYQAHAESNDADLPVQGEIGVSGKVGEAGSAKGRKVLPPLRIESSPHPDDLSFSMARPHSTSFLNRQSVLNGHPTASHKSNTTYNYFMKPIPLATMRNSIVLKQRQKRSPWTVSRKSCTITNTSIASTPEESTTTVDLAGSDGNSQSKKLQRYFFGHTANGSMDTHRDVSAWSIFKMERQTLYSKIINLNKKIEDLERERSKTAKENEILKAALEESEKKVNEMKLKMFEFESQGETEPTMYSP